MGQVWSPFDLHGVPAGAPYRRFLVSLPNGDRYFTVLGSDYLRVREADDFLFQHVARGGAEGTTEVYAGGLGLFLTWCSTAGVTVEAACGSLGRFMLWLRHYDPDTNVVAGPGSSPLRGPRRINLVLAAVREFYKHLVAVQALPGRVLDALYRVTDDRNLPDDARGEDSGLRLRLSARHRMPSVESAVPRASDDEAVALVRSCLNSRDQLIVLLAVRCGMRRGEIAGLRLSDVHLVLGHRSGCQINGPHLHVVRRSNPNRASAKSRRPRELPCDPLVVRAFDVWAAEREAIADAARCDFVFVTLTGPRTGSAIRPGLINEVFDGLCRRSGLDRNVHPHMLRHAMLSNVLDHGGTVDEAQQLAGHASPDTTMRTYVHPAPSRLRAAIERVPIPRINE